MGGAAAGEVVVDDELKSPDRLRARELDPQLRLLVRCGRNPSGAEVIVENCARTPGWPRDSARGRCDHRPPGKVQQAVQLLRRTREDPATKGVVGGRPRGELPEQPPRLFGLVDVAEGAEGAGVREVTPGAADLLDPEVDKVGSPGSGLCDHEPRLCCQPGDRELRDREAACNGSGDLLEGDPQAGGRALRGA